MLLALTKGFIALLDNKVHLKVFPTLLLCVCFLITVYMHLKTVPMYHYLNVNYYLIHMLIWRRQWHPTPVPLRGKSHGWRSLVGCSPWGRKESDTTEQPYFHFSLSCIGEGNGNPLQWSCLENPRDGGAWWAAVHGVAQSRTRLKWLSGSSRELDPPCHN